MNFLVDWITQPTFICAISGLAVGVIISLLVLIKTRLYKDSLDDLLSDQRYEKKRLEEQLNTQMRVSGKAQEDLLAKIAEKDGAIENLRITNNTLSKKPGRAELKRLITLETAIEAIRILDPNLGSKIDQEVDSASQSVETSNRGITPLIKKVFGSSAAEAPSTDKSAKNKP